MIKDKESYFNELAYLETAKLFLTEETNQISQEIYHNVIYISLSSDIAKQTSLEEIQVFLNKIKLNRQLQLSKADLNINLIYYLWFDEQTGQLRLNFINSNHHKLPFSCHLNIIQDESEIIKDFLDSPYLDGIPFEAFEELDANQSQLEEKYTLKIYCEILKKLQ